LGKCLAKLKKHDEALKEFDILAVSFKSPEGYFLKADLFSDTKAYNDALCNYNIILTNFKKINYRPGLPEHVQNILQSERLPFI